MMALLHPMLIALFANAMIYVGISFVNTQLLPSFLGNFYSSSNMWLRVLIMSVITGPAANYLFSQVYRMAGPANAGMMIIGTLAFVLVVKSMALNHTLPSMRIGLSAVALIGAALWLAYELGRMNH